MIELQWSPIVNSISPNTRLAVVDKSRSLCIFLITKRVQQQPGCDIRISNQILITRALHFARLRQAYYQASVTITLGRRV